MGQGSIATLICCELLADVHRLCETTLAKNEDGNAKVNEELEALHTYLCQNRGWRCLAVLQLLGVHEITCARELISLLLALYPLLSPRDQKSSPTTSRNPYIRYYCDDDSLDTLDITLQSHKKKKKKRNPGKIRVGFHSYK